MQHPRSTGYPLIFHHHEIMKVTTLVIRGIKNVSISTYPAEEPQQPSDKSDDNESYRKRKVEVQNYISVCDEPAMSKEDSTSITYEDERQAGVFPLSSRSSRTLPSPATEFFHQLSCKRRRQKRQWAMRFHKIASVTVREYTLRLR